MRIGLIIYGSLESVSGGYLYDRQLVDYLRRQGEEVVIISLPWRRYPAHLLDNFSSRWKAQLKEACQGLDLLLQDELNHPSLFWINRWLRRKFSFPIISIVHHLRSSEEHNISHRWLYPLIERAYLKTVDGFIFNSQTTRRSVEKMLDIPSTDQPNTGRRSRNQPSRNQPATDRYIEEVVAYPGADHLATRQEAKATKSRQKRSKKLPPLRLLCVGNVSVRKGLHTVLSALALVPPGTAMVDIVGSLENRAYVTLLEHQIARSGLSDLVTFWGQLSDEELCKRYRDADLLVVPSYEGFGIVYLEAMAFALPVIGSTAGAAHELITPRVNGFLIDPHDYEELAIHLIFLHQDRRQLKQMGKAARERYAGHPTWEESMEKVYRKIKQMAKRDGSAMG